MSISRWCRPTISTSVILSSCPQSFQASWSFPMCWLFTSGGQSIGVSASASVLPMNIQGLISFRVDWFDGLAVQGTLKSLLGAWALPQGYSSVSWLLLPCLGIPSLFWLAILSLKGFGAQKSCRVLPSFWILNLMDYWEFLFTWLSNPWNPTCTKLSLVVVMPISCDIMVVNNMTLQL